MNTVRKSTIYGLFLVAISSCVATNLIPPNDISNNIDVNQLNDDNSLIIACRKRSSDVVNYPDQHKIALSLNNEMVIFSQEYINKTVDKTKYSVEFIQENGYAFGLAIITKKKQVKEPVLISETINRFEPLPEITPENINTEKESIPVNPVAEELVAQDSGSKKKK